MNAHNPKAAIVFLVFLPQFVDPARSPVALGLLGLCFAVAMLGDSVYAWSREASATAFGRARRSAAPSTASAAASKPPSARPRRSAGSPPPGR